MFSLPRHLVDVNGKLHGLTALTHMKELRYPSKTDFLVTRDSLKKFKNKIKKMSFFVGESKP